MEAAHENEIENEASSSSPQASPLFPVQSSSDPKVLKAAGHTPWLSNTSFDSIILPTSTTSSATIPSDWYGAQLEENEGTARKASLEEPSYPILGSPTSEGIEEFPEESRKRAKRSKLEKNKKERGKDGDMNSKVSARANSEGKLAKDYYFDTHGDRDNLAFGSLYRLDVARYRPYRLMEELHLPDYVSFYKGEKVITILDPEGDSISLDDKAREEGRYWSARFVSIERRKDLKRIHAISSGKPMYFPSEDFIPLQQEPVKDQRSELESASNMECGETRDEFFLRRTREFNKMTRDRPHDESLWIAFAIFQDELAIGQRKKSVQVQALEKKISVLEKAIEFNPDSEELLLFYLETCKKRDNISVLMQRWENALMQHSGSYKLWRGFLHLCRGEFSSFTVSNMRKMYSHALQALSSARNQLYRKVCENAEAKSVRKGLLESEQALVDIFVSLCKFEWQTGHQELAIGLFQAEIEYSLFLPALKLSEQNKERLFEYFWSSEDARFGEDGALGWATWLEKEEEQRQKAKLLTADISEVEKGGWTGWSEPLSKINNEMTDKDQTFDEVPLSEDETELDVEESKQEDDIQSLLEKLGLNLDNEKEVEVKDPNIWKRWSEEEAKRDHEQWMPLHAKAGITIDHDELQNEDGEQLSRVILFEDIIDYLFCLDCDEARFSLIAQLIDFCNGPIIQWTSTNSPSWREKVASLEMLTGSLLEEVQISQHALAEKQLLSNVDMKWLAGSVDWVHATCGRGKFLRNVLLLSSKAFPQNHSLKEALLIAEGYAEAEVNSGKGGVVSSRALAKKLLKNNRQDLLLCGAYARIEAAAGNIDVARKIFDMALCSISDLSLDCQLNAPILYLSYAEAEFANHSNIGGGTGTSSKQRAIHILSCLGSGGKYSSYLSEHQVSSTQVLKARRGFEEQLRKLRLLWAQGDIKESSTALVAAAALFEDLTSGWEVAARVFEDAFSMVLPGRRHQSLQLEVLYLRYIEMLQKHKESLRPSQTWDIIVQGLSQYPWNSEMCSSLIRAISLPAFTSKLRRLFDEYCQKKPSTILWLFALSFELGRVGSGPRIHGLFERALTDQETQQSVMLWRCYLAYELHVANNPDAARRIYFRAIHACPWSKLLWLDAFQKLNNILTAKELSDLQEVMRDKELRLRTDIYEILLEDETRVS